MPPLFAHYLRQKWRGGICSNIHFFFCLYICPLSHSSQSLIRMRSTIEAFLKNNCFAECVLWSGSFVDTKLRGIEATCLVMVTGDDPAYARIPVWATKSLVVASEQRYSNFGCTCLRIQSATTLKASSENARHGAFTWGKIPRVLARPLAMVLHQLNAALFGCGQFR